jgi:hypothetical protein
MIELIKCEELMRFFLLKLANVVRYRSSVFVADTRYTFVQWEGAPPSQIQKQ